MSTIGDLMRDLRYGLRMLRKSPGFSAVVLVTLALGIGATVTVFGIIDAWLLKPLSFPHAERLVIGLYATRERPTEPAVFTLHRDYLSWTARSRSFESLSAMFPRTYLMSGAGDAASAAGVVVTEHFFDTLGVPAQLGRTLAAGDVTGPPSVVLSHGLWQRQFGGSTAVLGSSLTLNGVPYEIVGVMPATFDIRLLDQARGFELWTMLKPGEAGFEPGGMGSVAVLGRLREGVDQAAAQAELMTIHQESESAYQQNVANLAVLLTSLQGDNTRTVRVTLLTVGGAVTGLLLIAAMNVGALSIGRGLARTREAAIRVAIGSGRGRLLRQFLTESFALTMIGGALGLFVADTAIRLFAAWNPLGTRPATAIRIDGRALAFSALVIAITTIVCGLIPAWRVARTDPMDTLRSGGDRGAAGGPAQRAQSLMLTGQIAVSVVLLVGTTLLVRTFVRLQSESLGFQPANLTIASLMLPSDELDTGEKRNAFYQQLSDRLSALPGVQQVAGGTSPPLTSGPPVSVRTMAGDTAPPARISAQDVTTEFFDTLGIPLIAGRGFDLRDTMSAPPVVILNESAARLLFGSADDAVGRRVIVEPGATRDVIGIVGNTRSTFFNTLEFRVNPVIYLPAAQAFSTNRNPTIRSFGLSVHIRAERPLSMGEVRSTVSSLNPRVAVTTVGTAAETVVNATKQPAFRMTLLGWFAAGSLLLAAIGVYALVAQGVAQRTREIGIRLALGASANDVMRTVIRRALIAAVVGAVLGSVAALALANVMEALLYGVRARDASSFAFAATVLLVVTVAAALVPAIRATRVNLVRVLGAE